MIANRAHLGYRRRRQRSYTCYPASSAPAAAHHCSRRDERLRRGSASAHSPARLPPASTDSRARPRTRQRVGRTCGPGMRCWTRRPQGSVCRIQIADSWWMCCRPRARGGQTRAPSTRIGACGEPTWLGSFLWRHAVGRSGRGENLCYDLCMY